MKKKLKKGERVMAYYSGHWKSGYIFDTHLTRQYVIRFDNAVLYMGKFTTFVPVRVMDVVPALSRTKK